MKYTSKLILNGEEYQFAAPSGGGGRQPGANTIAYYSFDDQGADGYVKDFSGNGYNLTVGTQPTYSLLSGNNYVGVYSGSGKCSVNSSYTGDIKTISMWINIDTQQSQYVFALGTSGNQFSIIYGYDGSKLEFYSNYVRTTLIDSLSLNTWYHICLTRNNNLWTVYINNNQATTFTMTLDSFISISVGSSDSGDRMQGMLDNVIIEDKERTAQEISDYFNQTKSLYGIS